MHNFYTIETEAEFRRQEWQRAVAADLLAAQALAARPRRRLPHLPHLSFGRLRSLAARRLPFSSSLMAPRKTAAAARLVDC